MKIKRSTHRKAAAKPFNVAIYVRTACTPQVGDDPGIIKQKDTLLKFLEVLKSNEFPGNIKVRIYEDRGCSGLTMEHPGLKNLVHDLSLGSVDALLLTNSDRISRDPTHLDKFFVKLRDHGVKIFMPISGTKQFDPFARLSFEGPIIRLTFKDAPSKSNRIKQ